MNKIYHYDRCDGSSYFEYSGFVVIDENESAARKMLLKKYIPNGSMRYDMDFDHNFTVEEIGETMLDPRIVMEDYNEG